MMDSKPVEFRGSALDDLCAFPEAARREAGYQLDQIQRGSEPDGSEPGRAALPGFIEGARSMTKKRFANVWDAIEDTPAQAENMKLRSALIMALKDHISRTGLSQSEAAKLLGVTQPRISDLMRGKIELFGLDTLVNMIGAAGLHVEMRISDAA